MYEVGQVVSYATSGVCRITAREVRRVAGMDMEYYILKPLFDKSMTICVPAANQALVERMRPALDRDQSLEIIRGLPEQEVNADPDPDARRAWYTGVLKRGDHAEVGQMLRALYGVKKARQAVGKQLSGYEENVMREAETMLHTEFAYALGIHPREVAEFIRAELAGEHEAPLAAQA